MRLFVGVFDGTKGAGSAHVASAEQLRGSRVGSCCWSTRHGPCHAGDHLSLALG